MYFAMVFGAGFVLGTVRVLFVVPSIGTRVAELCEMPVMLVVIVLAARFVYRNRYSLLAKSGRALSGFAALALLIGAELLLAKLLQHQSISDYVTSRDPVAGSVYLAMLLLFAVLPITVRGRRGSPS